jgi:outer membrane protein TolC
MKPKMETPPQKQNLPCQYRIGSCGWVVSVVVLTILQSGSMSGVVYAGDGDLPAPLSLPQQRNVVTTSLTLQPSRADIPPAPRSDDELTEDKVDWDSSEPQRYLIDMTTALRLATTVNPRIGLAHESVREALALELGARSMLLPTLVAGTNYHLHTGKLQTSFGEIRTLNEQSIYFGGGSRTLAAETVAIPAVRVFAQLGDAVYAPLAACQVVAERNAHAHAVSNLTLLDVATNYLTLIRAETRVEALRLSLTQYKEVVRLTKGFAVAGQGRYADFHRARSHGLLILMELQRAEEDAAIASGNLAQMLRLDQSVMLESPPAPLELIVLTPLDTDR